MSRILKVMIVLLAIAAMVAPAMAEDRLSLNGQMYVRGWYMDNDSDAGSYTWVDQRLRTGGKYSIAEGVSVTFRFDVTEANWGSGPDGFGLRRDGSTNYNSMQWDRAHLDLNFGSFQVRAGQMWSGVSATSVVDAESNGIQVVAGPVKAFVMLTDDNDGAQDSDALLAAVQFSQKMDAVKFDVFAGTQNDNDEAVYVVGADAVASLDALTLTAELDYFTGDAAEDVDAMGAQLYVDAAFAATETVTVGAKAFYAMAADDDEKQYSYLGNNFGDWKPLTKGVGEMGGEKFTNFSRPFDFFKADYEYQADGVTPGTTDGSAGVMALAGYAKVKATEALALAGTIAYLVPEDDDMTTADSAFVITATSSYEMLQNAYLDATIQYVDVDAPGVEKELGFGVGLFVNF